MTDEQWDFILDTFRQHLADKVGKIVGEEMEGEGGNDEDGTYVAVWPSVEVYIVRTDTTTPLPEPILERFGS